MTYFNLDLLYSDMLIGEGESDAVVESYGVDPPLNDRIYWATLEDVRQLSLAHR